MTLIDITRSHGDRIIHSVPEKETSSNIKQFIPVKLAFSKFKIYTLCDGLAYKMRRYLTYNTRRYFSSCVVFRGEENYQQSKQDTTRMTVLVPYNFLASNFKTRFPQAGCVPEWYFREGFCWKNGRQDCKL